MKLSVLSTPNLITENTVRDTLSVVIDVLRATSSMAQAVHCGCVGILPAFDKERALTLKTTHREAILAGEIGGIKIPGFDLGNSPSEFSTEAVSGKEIIMATSNGTKAILKAQENEAKIIVMASFLNLSEIVSSALDIFLNEIPAISVICAGSHGEFASEDFACAGAFCSALKAQWEIRRKKDLYLSESAKDSIRFFETFEGNILKALEESQNGQHLKSIGYCNDLKICAQKDTRPVVPLVVDDWVKPLPAKLIGGDV